MEAILKFTLPDEEESFRVATNAERYRLVLREFQEWLRAQRKHGKPMKGLDAAWEELIRIIHDEGIDLD